MSRVQLFSTPWTAAYQAPLSMGVSREEYWSGVPLPSPILKYIIWYKRWDVKKKKKRDEMWSTWEQKANALSVKWQYCEITRVCPRASVEVRNVTGWRITICFMTIMPFTSRPEEWIKLREWREWPFQTSCGSKWKGTKVRRNREDCMESRNSHDYISTFSLGSFD